MDAIRVVPIPLEDNTMDKISWTADTTGKFSVRLAFNAITRMGDVEEDGSWI